jgi:HAAS
MRDDQADLVAAYLEELRARLRAPDAELVIAEAEDHLRESVAAGIGVGMSEVEAQEAAISAFGSVRAVVRAHNLRSGQVAKDLVMAALKLGWIGMFAVAASGLVAWAMDGLFGRSFVGGLPTATASFAPAQCQYWQKLWPGAHTCAQAAMLESSSDAVSLRVIGGGIAGMVLLGVYLLALMYWRPGGVRVLPGGFFPLVAAAVFAVGTLALVVCAFTGSPFDAPAGPGSFLSGAVIALGMSVAHGVSARRLLRFRTALPGC